MSEEEAQYDHIPGKLKLQSAGAVVKKDKKSKKDKKKKAKKQHKRQREKEQEEEEMDQGGARAVPLEPVSLPAMTPTERKFLEQKRLREEERLKKVASKSHRERVAEYNERLAGLTDHFDLPRIGPG